jgi:DNA-directed RNA polymerase subunit M/transcription elongation factor TFIIS
VRVNRDDAEERKARIDMIVKELRLTADDLRERAKQATDRALQTAVESRRTIENARTARAGKNASPRVKPPPSLPTQSPQPIPPCPKCHRIDRSEEEEQTGSSTRWFVCDRCGIRYTLPPRR